MPLKRKELKNGFNIWIKISLVFFLLAVLLVVFYSVKHPTENSFGERFIIDEIPLLISSFTPLTLTTFSIFVGWLFFLEGIEQKISNLNFSIKRFIIFISLFVLFVSVYEFFWNMYAWFTLWGKDGGQLNSLINRTHDYTILPANFYFATKTFFLMIGISLYTAYYLSKK